VGLVLLVTVAGFVLFRVPFLACPCCRGSGFHSKPPRTLKDAPEYFFCAACKRGKLTFFDGWVSRIERVPGRDYKIITFNGYPSKVEDYEK
jgi:hypothetical protein